MRPTANENISLFCVREDSVPEDADNFNYFVSAEVVEAADIRVGDRLVFDEPAELVERTTDDGVTFRHVRGGKMSRRPRQTEVVW